MPCCRYPAEEDVYVLDPIRVYRQEVRVKDTALAKPVTDPPLNPRFALLVLNTEIGDTAKARELWEKAHFRLLVDGGANRVADSLGPDLLPDLITGDLDSIRPEVRQGYADRGVPVIETEDQDYTDFTKALLQLAGKNLQACF